MSKVKITYVTKVAVFKELEEGQQYRIYRTKNTPVGLPQGTVEILNPNMITEDVPDSYIQNFAKIREIGYDTTHWVKYFYPSGNDNMIIPQYMPTELFCNVVTEL